MDQIPEHCVSKMLTASKYYPFAILNTGVRFLSLLTQVSQMAGLCIFSLVFEVWLENRTTVCPIFKKHLNTESKLGRLD